MAGRNSLAGGDRLARGARSVTFMAGDAKKNEKFRSTKAHWQPTRPAKNSTSCRPRNAQKIGPRKSAPVMKRTPRPLYDRVVIRTKRTRSVSAPSSSRRKPRKKSVRVKAWSCSLATARSIQRQPTRHGGQAG